MPLTEAQKQAQDAQAVALLASPAKADNETSFLFPLEGGLQAAVVLGPHGLADASLTLGNPEKHVVFAGVPVHVLDQPLAGFPSELSVKKVTAQRQADGKVRVIHKLHLGDEVFDLNAVLAVKGPALQVTLEECAKYITEVALGNADTHANRVFYGHGYCLVEPEAFLAHPGGHNLAASHAGFEFANGLSLLQACRVPPHQIAVNPATKTYALRTHPHGTLTFLPGLAGAFDCARQFRAIDDREGSPNVARKAGRFVFDIWGGRYADNEQQLSRMFDYGLTDSLYVLHDWQRWGYDVRLPDIYPPNPRLGTLADMRQLAAACAAKDVPFCPHDNYIDMYPDCTDYSYDHITFLPDGTPRKAWYNPPPVDAQSYQFRPDHIRPFYERNVKLMAPTMKPTGVFVDVFTSIDLFDFRDRAGKLHSRLETQKCWGEMFQYMQKAFGGNAVTMSEAGSDQLLGYVDGADCQLMMLYPEPRDFNNTIKCKQWSIAPWLDTVLHDRFSLHGVGYSSRYQGGRSFWKHGIRSDDYISAEVLLGRALMVDRNDMGYHAVRKYWLAQDFIRSIAMAQIKNVEFVENDLFRVKVTWNNGATVWCNRGQTDWQVEDVLLPPYGYLAKNGSLQSAILRLEGQVVEAARDGDKCFYVNGRGYLPGAPLSITPTVEKIDYLGDRRFKMTVAWQAEEPAPQGSVVFYHFDQARVAGATKPSAISSGGKTPDPATWKGLVKTGDDWIIHVSPDIPLGVYKITVGLYNPSAGGVRYQMRGQEDGGRRYILGKLHVEGDKASNTITAIRLEKTTPPADMIEVPHPNPKPTAFGPATTDGGFRCQMTDRKITVTPLPDARAFTLTLAVNQLAPKKVVKGVNAVDAAGIRQGEVKFRLEDGKLTFTTNPADFAYVLDLGA